jgi:FO synthase
MEPWERIEAVVLDDAPLDRVLDRAAPAIRRTLDHALERVPPTVEEGEALLSAEGDDLTGLVRVADAVRAADVGDRVTYVVNRNINFTNVCFVNCHFCAFKRQRWEEDAYTHGVAQVLAKVEEAVQRGATEVCMQGGINPDMQPSRTGTS